MKTQKEGKEKRKKREKERMKERKDIGKWERIGSKEVIRKKDRNINKALAQLVYFLPQNSYTIKVMHV